ncbi:ribosome maturation factor RimM [Nitratiruptor tergarcus]|uniref:Ribosome maturation factor RimM n=1 Tax=Nitratiruptor tergarcus DSM 16512 TaxID=1069081 RepID=A0A1W1WPS1_9BACT|nr:ribosome maturation factor RimM [Nitratiruptor tergarcus]SMC08308.1 16S rRNA processing protein RimM [Nitratiruptor tergarcus DSM 16512]
MKKLAIARLGRSVGLKGEMRFFDLSDFPEQFQEGASFESDRGKLTIERINPQRGTIKFVGINTPEDAKKLTNAYLYSDEQKSKEQLNLNEGEYFWFEIIGLDIYENSEYLGKVQDIQRMPQSDYLLVQTAPDLIQKNLPKSFLLPFSDPFIVDVDLQKRRIVVAGARDILEAS